MRKLSRFDLGLFYFLISMVLAFGGCDKDRTPLNSLPGEPPAPHLLNKLQTPFNSVYSLRFGPGNLLYANSTKGLFVSNDFGKSWDSLSYYSSPDLFEVSPYNDLLLMGGFGVLWGWFAYSDDGGKSWQAPQFTPHSLFPRTAVFLSNGRCLMGSTESDESYGGIYFSDDNALIWRSTGFDTLFQIYQLFLLPNGDIYASGLVRQEDQLLHGIYRSPDNGDTWEQVYGQGQNMSWLYKIRIVSDRLFYGCDYFYRFFISRDGGRTWQQQGSLPEMIADFEIADDGQIVLSVYNSLNGNPGQLFYSSDSGQTFYPLTDQLLAEPRINDIQIGPADTLYLSDARQGLFKSVAPLSEIIGLLQLHQNR